MSLLTMSLESSRSSAFTFESSVHSSHVLRCLDDQRRRDVLCDLTVVVEGESFRAHRSVLASCSQYFTNRVSSHAGQGLILTLPAEVTVSGFEPLLRFAYTSKLLFSKDNAIEIRNCAGILGFKDLDKACFDFLLPKFFPSTKGSAPLPKKTCCKTRCKKKQPAGPARYPEGVSDTPSSERGVQVSLDSPSEQESAAAICHPGSEDTGSKSGGLALPLQSDGQSDGPTDYSLQCPEHSECELVCGKGAGSLQKLPGSPAPAHGENCPPPGPPASLSNLPSSRLGGRGEGPATEAPGRDLSQIKEEVAVKRERSGGDGGVRGAERGEERSVTVERRDHASESRSIGGVRRRPTSLAAGEREEHGERSGDEEEAERLRNNWRMKECGGGTSGRGRSEGASGGSDRSSMEREVAENLAWGLWSELSSPTFSLDVGYRTRSRSGAEGGTGGSGMWAGVGLGLETGAESEAGPGLRNRALQAGSAAVDGPKLQLDPSSRTGDCIHLQTPDPGRGTGTEEADALLPACDGSYHSGWGHYVSSLTSGEDGDSDSLDTEGDSESYTSEMAKKVQLPFSVNCVVSLTRNDFQQMLKQHSLTRHQLDFVHDVRRRSKNRAAAQRCRKRKLDCIHDLEFEINKLRTEKEKLMTERNQLSQLKLKTWHSVSALYQRLCSEAALRPEQLQVLSKYYGADCPLSSLIPSGADCPLSSLTPSTDPLFTGLGEILQPQAPNSAFSAVPAADIHQNSFEPSPSCSREMPACNEHSANGKAP